VADGRLIYPMLAMVLLTFSTLVRLVLARRASVAEGVVSACYFKVYQGSTEPEASAQLARHFTNLFEAPVLFYAACISALAIHATGTPFLALAWVYVLLRITHTYVHTGKNVLNSRILAYFSSWLVVLAMWTLLAITAWA
jgi:hypothetical protein